MLALYRSGRQADALQALRRAGRRLDEELGVEPAAELRDLEFRILNQDPDLDLQPATVSSDDRTAVSAQAGPRPRPHRWPRGNRRSRLTQPRPRSGRATPALTTCRRAAVPMPRPDAVPTTCSDAPAPIASSSGPRRSPQAPPNPSGDHHVIDPNP